MTYIIATFYKFVSLPDYAEMQPDWLAFCQQHGVKGTILLAREGINATLAAPRAGIDAVLEKLRADPRLADIAPKESVADTLPFQRLKVRLKQELIPLGVTEVDPSEQVGIYVEPEDWNSLISDPDVVLIDTRNQYEVAIGTFKGAHNPELDSFRQFPGYAAQHLDPTQHPKVAMFCTGGIRCEKASAYLLQRGFQEVYHLKGGILKYLEEVPPDESLWQGECFVFDERVAVTHGLQPGTYEMCRACGHPISPEDKASPHYQPNFSCPHCATNED